MGKLLRFLSSLRLTIVLLCLLLGLVFIGTLAQVQSDIFVVQRDIFYTMVVWIPLGHTFAIPVYPGGGFLAWLLLINLLVAHTTRFSWTFRKSGLWLIHTGLIILIASMIYTALFSVESQCRFRIGEAIAYSTDLHRIELVAMDHRNPEFDQVISFDETKLRSGQSLKLPKFGINWQVIAYRNGTVTIQRSGESLTISSKPTYVDGFEISLRLKRYYTPYTLTLVDFKHDSYTGTDIPSRFLSRVRLDNPLTNEHREVQIVMNQPFRYAGKTYYQAGYDDNDTVSVLQVVQNPGWLVPYVSCGLMGFGLMVHFLLLITRRKSP